MAAAHLGVATGRHGSGLAPETSDAVIVRDELAILLKVMDLSGFAHCLVKTNRVFASVVIASLVIVDLIWILPLPLGVAGQEGSTVVVGFNGLRILRRSVWQRAGTHTPQVPQPTPARDPLAATGSRQ